MSPASNGADTDVAIIGAGPVGLFSVFQCGMLGFRCHVIDVLDTPGGQCAALYPEKPIYDIPGYPAVDAMELVDKLLDQAAPFDPVYHLGHPVIAMEPMGARPDGTNRGWHLKIGGGREITARSVIIAGGSGAFGAVRLPLDGAEEFEGKSLFYLVRRKADLAGKRVVIAGGGDSAVDWAVSLAGVAEHIYVVHRRDKFRAAPESVRRMHDLAEPGGAVELVVPYQLAALEGTDGQITSVKVATLDGAERVLEADVVLAFFGLVNNIGPIAEWGLELDHHTIAVRPDSCATNLHGVFAIGDIAAYPGKLKLILTGFSEAAMAAHAIHPLLHPGEALHFEYSTTKGLPGAAK